MNTLRLTGLTDVGRRRIDNQDTFICTTLWSESCALLAVIDGVGGYVGGDRAAAIAKESIEQYMATPKGDPLSMLREAVVYANNQISAHRQQDPRLVHMCCVLTAAVVDCQLGQLYFAHVGDTRLYRYRQGTLEKLTHDHSAVGAQEDAKELTESEAMQHPRRNEILREVGLKARRVDDPDFLESGQTDFQPGDQVLLCSDGLTDMVRQKQIEEVLSQALSPDAQVAELIRLANQQGGHDNITAVIARNGSVDSIQDKTPSPTHLVEEGPAPPGWEDSTASTKGQVRVLVPILLAFLVGGMSVFAWYRFQPSVQSSPTVADSVLTDTIAQPGTITIAGSGDRRLDSLLRIAYQSQAHELVLPADTFWLEKPLILPDSLVRVVGDRQLSVIRSADTRKQQVALRVSGQGMVDLENVVIRGFKTGIELLPGASLRLTNVHFMSVDFPVSILTRQANPRDNSGSATGQNQRKALLGHKNVE